MIPREQSQAELTRTQEGAQGLSSGAEPSRKTGLCAEVRQEET